LQAEDGEKMLGAETPTALGFAHEAEATRPGLPLGPWPSSA
jgi:hypothetical protein